MKRLPRRFYARPAEIVAPELLGKVLAFGDTAGRIVEVEAYLGKDDLAAHSARGVTDRTRVIFGPPGHAYVYFIYGMYECLNVVAEPEGRAGCVLIRAVEPVLGVAAMQARRGDRSRLEDLASGPGKLTRAMGITRELNGSDLVHGPLTIAEPETPAHFSVRVTPRIGISRCRDWPLRFIIEGSRFVSKPRH